MFKLFRGNKKVKKDNPVNKTENLVNKPNTDVDSSDDNKEIIIVNKIVTNTTEYPMYFIKVLINSRGVSTLGLDFEFKEYYNIKTLNEPFVSDSDNSLSEEEVDLLFVKAKNELIDFIVEKDLVESETLLYEYLVYDFNKPDGERAYLQKTKITTL